jgi:hypothetical protein
MLPNTNVSPPGPGARGVTMRAILLGALLIPINAFWIVRLEKVLFGPYPSTISLFANIVFLLFLFVGGNLLLRQFAPRLAFGQGELLTIYTMLAISTALAGLDGVGILSQIMPHGVWFGETRQYTGFLDVFPDWLVVKDREVLRGHFLGNDSFYRLPVLRAWAVPILAWTLFISLLMLVANAINVLVRRRWADQERLTFPIIQLPLAMSDGGTGATFFQNRLMWAGFALAAGLSLWNGIAFLYPSLPSLPLGITDYKPYMTTKPWSAIDWFPVTFYPLAIGLGFLLPLDLLFSCWFFFLFWKGQMVVSNAMAWDTTPDFPFIKEQGFGAVMGLFLFYLWSGRKYYAEVWRNAVTGVRGQVSGTRESELTPDTRHPASMPEALSDRGALLCIGGGLLGLLAFGVAAGVAWWVMVAFFALFLPMLVVVTRIRAELGSPVHDFHFMGPDNMLPRAFGASAFRQPDLAFFTFSFALTRAHRSDAMPNGLEGLQMARLRQMDQRRMFLAILLASLLGTLCAFWAFEHQAYMFGTTAKFNQGYGFSQQAFDRMRAWVGGTQDIRPNLPAVTAMSAGFLTTLGLLFLRLRFFGFPLHPIGYAVSSSWSIHLVWVPLFIAWLLKLIAMRYGGLRAYRQFLPFFLGLVLGDCVMGSVWALCGLLLNMRAYNFFGA